MNFEQAKEKILKEGIEITRHGWGLCKVIRKPYEGPGRTEYEEYEDGDPEMIIEHCEGRQCPCKIGVFKPTPEDLKADDYVIAI